MARPSLLTDTLRERIEAELADGFPVAVVAQRAHVGRSTLHDWIREGYVERRRRPSPLELVGERVVPSAEGTTRDSESLDQRLAAAEPGLVAAIVKASQRGSWQAAAWLLERTAPERWARPTRSSAITEPPVPRPGSPFAEVDELAARRRRERR